MKEGPELGLLFFASAIGATSLELFVAAFSTAHGQNCLLLPQLAEKQSAVADDSAGVAGDIGGGSVLDEFGVI